VTGGTGKRSSGFTLLEVLVSLTLLTVIVSVSFGALRLSSRSWEAAQARSDDLAETRIALDFLRRQIGQILPKRWRQGNRERIAFEGEEGRVRFIAPAPFQHAGVGLYEFLLQVDNSGGDTSLALYYEPFYPGASEFRVSDASPRSLLLGHVETAGFAFYGAPTEKSEAEWTPAWDPAAEFYPRLVRLQLQPAGGEDPELVLRFALPTGGQDG
jgi:general secretion pathway protein J